YGVSISHDTFTFVFYTRSLHDALPISSCPLRHSISFSSTFHACFRINDMDPITISKRLISSSLWFNFSQDWKFNWEFLFFHSSHCSIFPVDNWNSLTPITLTREQPIS